MKAQLSKTEIKRPDANIPITIQGTYHLLKDIKVHFDWERYAKDLEKYYESKLKERDFSLNVNDPYQFVLTDKKGNTYSFNPQKKWGEELNDFLVGNVNIKN